MLVFKINNSNSFLKQFSYLKLIIMSSLFRLTKAAFSVIVLVIVISSCDKNNDTSNTTGGYMQVNLVADTAGYGAARIDPVLANAWGIAIGSSGALWIAANHTGSTTIY